MKVLWLTNIPSPYRVRFFEELGKCCELTVLFEKRASAERDDSWKNVGANNYKAVFLKGKSIGVAEAFCPAVVGYLNRGYEHIVVTNYSDPTGMLAVAYMKMKKIPYEIEGDGAFPGSGKGLKAWLKRFMLSGAQRCFSTAALHDQYYGLYGVKAERVVRYPFTSVLRSAVLERPASLERKQELRRNLRMPEKHIVLAVGQFIHRKGFDILIRAAAQLGADYGIYIVGGGATEEYLELVRAFELHNVHFVGFMEPQKLGMFYEAADVFAHPTREDIWGLVVNEAMAKGLPVVSTDRCVAALEMIEDGVSGKLIPTEDAEALAEAIEICVRKRQEMSSEALKKAEYYTIETMAEIHAKAWSCK